MPVEPSGGPKRLWYKRPPVLIAGAVVLLIILLAALGSATSPKKQTGSSNRPSSTTSGASSTTTSNAGDEDNLSGPGAPTVDGSVAAAGSGSQPGSSACRSGDPLANVYHPNRLRVMQACTTVSGVVETVRHEDDGDVHFDLALDSAYTSMLTAENYSAQHGWLVVEIVPADEPGCTPGQPPKPATGTYDYGLCTGADEVPPALGSHVYVTGPYVLDEDHGGWAEIHPAWAISSSLTVPPTTAPAPATTAPPPTEPPATAPPPPVASHSCSASMSNPSPGDSGYDTVNITSNVPNAPVTITKHYKTTTSTDSGETDANGAASIPFNIGHPTVGYTVEVDVSINSGEATCSTSFTPQ